VLDVLVIEDDEDLRELSMETLRAGGYCVDGVGDPDLARAYLRNRRPRVLLLDLMLGGLSGACFVDELRASPSLAALPVVLVSGASNLAAHAASAGADAWLEKPITSERLLEVVARFCAPTTRSRSAH